MGIFISSFSIAPALFACVNKKSQRCHMVSQYTQIRFSSFDEGKIFPQIVQRSFPFFSIASLLALYSNLCFFVVYESSSYSN